MYLAFKEDVLVGVASLSASPRPRLRHSMDVAMSVRKAYWRQGIATKLMTVLVETLKTLPHVIQLTLHVREDNTHARHLYQVFGFVETGIFPRHLHINNQFFNSVFMVKSLKP